MIASIRGEVIQVEDNVRELSCSRISSFVKMR